MDNPEKIYAIIDTWLNKLEPDYLLADFFHYPPIGFNVDINENCLPVFSINFDLTTTMDPRGRKRLKALPLYRFWARLLRYNTLFVGTTVSEFCPIPSSLNNEAATNSLLQKAKQQYPLVIVKDLPKPSCLISDEDAKKNQAFLAALEQKGFLCVAGQALAFVPIDYSSIDDYMAKFSKVRRKDFRRKMRAMENLKVEVLTSNAPLFHDDKTLSHFYALYKQVYNQSDIHFDLLSQEFFRHLLQEKNDSLRVFIYRDEQNAIIGYNICFIVKDMLVDKYIGFDYPAASKNNLYFISWFHNLEFARQEGLKYYIAGWTDPEIKAYLGANVVYTQHAVFIKNPLLRWILKRFQRHFERDAQLDIERRS